MRYLQGRYVSLQDFSSIKSALMIDKRVLKLVSNDRVSSVDILQLLWIHGDK